MLPSATVIGEFTGMVFTPAGFSFFSGVDLSQPQPDKTITAQTGKIRPARRSEPQQFAYCVLRINLLLSSISGNHPQKGTPEPLQIGPGMVQLKHRLAPLALHRVQLRLGGQRLLPRCVSIVERLAGAGLHGLGSPVRIRQLR
jgi:hypothetical protein